jgi:predicted PurR-regulated permease PerM
MQPGRQAGRSLKADSVAHPVSLDPLAAARGDAAAPDTDDAQAAVERPRTVDARGAALTILGVAAAILLARYMQDVLIPFVLAGLVFYALDPIVDRLQRWHVPRSLGAALAITLIVGASVATVYSLRDDAMGVVEELPVAAQKIRAQWTARRNDPPTALEKVQKAARELEETAAAAASPAATPRGVERVQIEEPTFRASAYLWWTSLGAVVLVSQAVFVLFLAYFLLVYDDLFKRKLVENVGPHFGKKKLTVQILNDIAWQIERFMLVQILTCTVVGVVTWLVLWWIGLQHAAVWGLVAGVLNIVPYFGPLFVAAGLGVVGYLQFGTVSVALGVAGISFLITTIEGYWLTPSLMGRFSEINRIALFAGILFWSWLWGIPGMLLAIPLMVAIKAVCDGVEDLQPIGRMLGE